MGKIRVKSLGIEELEKEQTQDAKKRKEAKTARLAQGSKQKLAKGAHGGERLVSMAPSEEEIAKEIEKSEKEESRSLISPTSLTPPKSPKASRQRSRHYAQALTQVDRNRRYPLIEAISLLKKIGTAKFDATVELHINTIEKGVNGQVKLPHGTGKTVRVAIADVSAKAEGDGGSFDSLLKKIESGKIDFDVLIAHPSAMAKLAKVAKILGPRGLMPNPKAGTISETPQELAKKFEGGAINFRTESQAPIVHAIVGKVSFKEKHLEENVGTFLRAVGAAKVRSVTLKSTMSPGIKIDFTSI